MDFETQLDKDYFELKEIQRKKLLEQEQYLPPWEDIVKNAVPLMGCL